MFILYIGRVNPYYITDDITHTYGLTNQEAAGLTWEDLNHGLQGHHWMAFSGGWSWGIWVGFKLMAMLQIFKCKCNIKTLNGMSGLVLPVGNHQHEASK